MLNIDKNSFVVKGGIPICSAINQGKGQNHRQLRVSETERSCVVLPSWEQDMRKCGLKLPKVDVPIQTERRCTNLKIYKIEKQETNTHAQWEDCPNGRNLGKNPRNPMVDHPRINSPMSEEAGYLLSRSAHQRDPHLGCEASPTKLPPIHGTSWGTQYSNKAMY